MFGLNRIPIDTRQPLTFGIAVFIEYLLTQSFISVSIIFLTFYICICTYFWSAIDDLSALVTFQAVDTDQRIAAKKAFTQFVTLHINLFRILSMFEGVIAAPMFFELPIFGLTFAILLYQLENVSAHVRK